VALVDGARTELLTSKASFYISLQSALPRSWIMYAPLPPPTDAFYINARGMQYNRAGNTAKAQPLLEEACRRAPASVPYALDLARLYVELKDYAAVERVATPFYQAKKNYEFAEALGQSAQALGRYPEAVAYYKDYLTYFGTNIHVLNAIGDCYVKTGELAGAVTVWKKSLELSPSQPELVKKLADIQDKIK
jgi:tetratricopeptide (TPR) repeat protein